MSCMSVCRTLAEDAGFEPARAVNPTRVPGERHRPLGESSVAMVAEPLTAAAGRTSLASGQVLHSRWTPRGVYPVNSPRAGRQQGSMGSVGCAGSPLFVVDIEDASCRFTRSAVT